MKVIKNYLYNATYQLIAIIVPLITAPYVSRVLHAGGIGINAYTNSVIQYFILFAQFGVSLYGSKQIATVRNNKTFLSRNFWEIQIFKLITTTIATIGTIIFIFLYRKYTLYFFIQLINVIAVLFDISWFFSGLEQFKTIVVRNTIVRLLSVFLVFSLIKNSKQTGIYIFILAISSLIGNLTLWPYLRGKITFVKFKNLNFTKHFIPSLSLFIPTIATTIYMQLNKTMLGAFSGIKYAGYYYNSDQLIRAVLSLATSLGTVMLPHVAAAYANGDQGKVNRLLINSFDSLSLVCMPMFLGMAAISTKLGPYFYGDGFSIVGKVMLMESPIIIFIAWNNTIGNQFLIPTGMNSIFTKSVVYGAVFNIIANIPMIYFFNIYGAMLVTDASEAFVAIYQLISIRNIVPLKKLFVNIPKYFMASIIMFIPVFTLNNYLPATIIFLIFEIIVGLGIYIITICVLRPSSVNILIDLINRKDDKK
ncbi:polysaccharide biosynthesis C-terminal domain-containing protein [Limosilactobacillus vaginalis]|uniref:oligosaccharide flippase family protein n=1 Tax=Limosilactobacillus vaginalis TaxID=1633 RepID=UPI00388DC5EB